MPERSQHRADPRRPGPQHSRHRAADEPVRPRRVQPDADSAVAWLLADARRDLGLGASTAGVPAEGAPAAGDSAEGAPAARHRHRDTAQPPVSAAAGPARARHRSTPASSRPVGRSLAGALAVLGVVGAVEITTSTLASGHRAGTADPATDPAALSGLHSVAPPLSPAHPGSARTDAADPDDAAGPDGAADLPEPRRAADGNDPDGTSADGDDDRRHRKDDPKGRDDRADGSRSGSRADGPSAGGGPRLPDLPGLGLPGLLPGVGRPGGDRARTANCGKPGRILDLSKWKLTLPTGSSGKPTEIAGTALAALGNLNFGTDSRCEAVAFRAPVNGVTTKGSKNPRSELREMGGPGNAKAGWSSSSGTHTMTVREAFTRLPDDKPHLVGAQIHDAADDVSVFRLEGTNLYVTNGDDPHYKLVTTDYKLGTPFEAKYVVSGGQVKAYYNGQLVTTIVKNFSDAYFKAGAYTQANCGNARCAADNYGETLIYDLDVTHT